MSRPFLTNVISAWDHRQEDLSAFCVPFEVDQEQLAESLLSVQKKYAYRVNVDTVAEGDIAVLRCQSEKPKFQKNSVTVNVGKNLYSRELEAQLPGMAVGAQRDVTVGDVTVSVQVLQAERTVLPELTDAFVARNFETVHTMQELEAWYVNGQREDHIKLQAAQAADFLQGQILSKSEILVDEGERLQVRASGEKIVREMWELNGLPLDQMSDGQAAEILGYPSAQAYIDWFAGLSEMDVSLAALGYELLLADGHAPTEESYRETLRKMMEEEYIPAEQLKDYTYPAYARQVCTEHYRTILETYAYQTIKEKLS